MSILLTDEDRALVGALTEERPGVTRDRIGRAIWRLGRRVHQQQPELLDDELAAMDQEAADRRRARKALDLVQAHRNRESLGSK